MSEKTYQTILDYDLQYLETAVDFLNKSNSDIGWTFEGMYRKLSNENPSGSGYLAVAILNNEVVGTASLTKKTALINGVKTIVAEVGDTYTDPIYRRLRPKNNYHYDNNSDSYVNKSMFGRLLTMVRDAAINDGIQIIYGTPNENSYPGYTKHLGFVPTENFRINSYFRCKTRYFIKKILSKTNLKINFKKPLIKNLDNIKSLIQEEYEVLIKSMPKANIDFMLLKDFNYIKFRYILNGSYFYYKNYLNNRINGVIIYKLKEINNINYLIICDIFCLNNSAANKCVKALTKLKYVDALVIWTDSNSYRKMKLNQLFFLKKNNIPIIIYKNNTEISDNFIKSYNLKFGIGCTDNV